MDEIRGMPGWRRVRSLGAGSYGTVYEIQKEQSGHLYRAALKVMSIPRDEAELHAAYADGMDEQSASSYFSTLVDAISSECAMMYELSGNTNIVAYQGHEILPHDNGIGADILIRMELLQPLTEYISNTALSEADVIRLGTDLCRALELCEKRDIVHRDVKPANIFVSKNGDYKLGDFGIARTMSTHGTMTSKRGTYTYMSPEVYFGKKDYDHTADLYSLGLVLYWCLNERRLPFEPPAGVPLTARDRENALDERLDGKPIPRPVQCSDELWEVIRKATAFDKRGRFQRAEEMRSALEKCLAGGEEPEPQDITDPPQPSVVPENEKKHPKKWIPILCGALLIAAIGVVLLLGQLQKHSSDPPAEPTGSPTPAAEESAAVTENLPSLINSKVDVVFSTDLLLVGDRARASLMTDGAVLDSASVGAVWSSSDDAIASVADGVVTGNAPGTATVRCEVNGEVSERELRVVALDESSGVVIRADYDGLSMKGMDSTTVNLTLSGNVPEHYGASAYSSDKGLNVRWSAAEGDNLQLEISTTIWEFDEGNVTVLLYPKDDPDHILAAKVIRVRMN